VPSTLDFDLWQGPAPRKEYQDNLVHYNWHWFWDFGNGDIGNQGVHEVDVARWALGGKLPRSVVSLGGRYVDTPDFKDQGQTPNQLVTVFDFDGVLLLFETRGLVESASIPGFKEKYPRKVANELYFEDGVIKNWKFYPKGKDEGEKLVQVDYKIPKTRDHFANFLSAVRSRKREDLTAEIEEGHRSAALCHLANISYRLAKERPFEKPKDFCNNEIVGESVMATLENTKAIGIDPSKATLWVGPKLQFDPEKEKFIDNSAANRMLSRAYRKPFVVPEKV